MSDGAPALLIVLITILFPPVGVAMVAGCGFDLFVNICLTILGCKPPLTPSLNLFEQVGRLLFAIRTDRCFQTSLATFTPSTSNMSTSIDETVRDAASLRVTTRLVFTVIGCRVAGYASKATVRSD